MKFEILSKLLLESDNFINYWIDDQGKKQFGKDHWDIANKFLKISLGVSSYGKAFNAGWIRVVETARDHIFVNFALNKPTKKALETLENTIVSSNFTDGYYLDVEDVDGNENYMAKTFASIEELDKYKFLEKVKKYS